MEEMMVTPGFRLSQEVETRLFQYRRMRAKVQAYREDMENGLNARTQEPKVRTSLLGDPTARDALHLVEPPERIREMLEWVEVIERAWGEMQHFAPELARVLEGFFGLRLRGVNEIKMHAGLRYRLMEQLCIGQTTLYRRKDACVDWVKALALYRGLLCPALPCENELAVVASNDVEAQPSRHRCPNAL